MDLTVTGIAGQTEIMQFDDSPMPAVVGAPPPKQPRLVATPLSAGVFLRGTGRYDYLTELDLRKVSHRSGLVALAQQFGFTEDRLTLVAPSGAQWAGRLARCGDVTWVAWESPSPLAETPAHNWLAICETDAALLIGIEAVGSEPYDLLRWHFLARGDAPFHSVLEWSPATPNKAALRVLAGLVLRIIGNDGVNLAAELKGGLHPMRCHELWMQQCSIVYEQLNESIADGRVTVPVIGATTTWVISLLEQLLVLTMLANADMLGVTDLWERNRIALTSGEDPLQTVWGPLWDRLVGQDGLPPAAHESLWDLDQGLANRGGVILPAYWWDEDRSGSLVDLLRLSGTTLRDPGTIIDSLALSPWIYSLLFETLLSATVKARHGIFYTPADAVHFMSRRALVDYLLEVPGSNPWSGTQWRALFDPITAARWRELPLMEPQQANDLLGALLNFRVIDPAVGGGAFLVGVLDDWTCLYRVLSTIAEGHEIEMEPLHNARVAWAAAGLYGVDIQPIAVCVTRLRIWFATLLVGRTALWPDIDCHILVGDALLETWHGGYDALLGSGQPHQTDLFTQPSAVQQELERILQDFRRAEPLSRTDQRRLRAAEKAFTAELMADDLDRLLQQQSSYKARAVAHGNTPDPMQLEAWQTAVSTQAIMLDDLQRGAHPNLLVQFYFREVMLRGGFDLVIGNPPYVRGELIPPAIKAQLESTYPHVYTGKSDLYVYFYIRGFELLRPGGRLAFLTSNKFFRADYGTLLRLFLADHCRLELLLDLGDLPMFKATTDLCIWIGVKPPSPTIEIKGLHPSKIGTGSVRPRKPPILAAPLFPDWVPDPITAAPPESRRTVWTPGRGPIDDWVRDMSTQGTKLGDLPTVQVVMGVKTGFNKAYLIAPATRARWLDQDPSIADWVVPVLRGREVRKYAVSPELFLLIPPPAVTLAKHPLLIDHLAQYRESLERRTVRGKLWWEISLSPDAEQALRGDKIVYPDISHGARFAWVGPGLVPLDTCFTLVGGDWYLLGLLNSASFWTYMLCSCPLMGGVERNTVRLKASSMRNLPIVQAAAKERDQIAALAYKAHNNGGMSSDDQDLLDSLVVGVYGIPLPPSLLLPAKTAVEGAGGGRTARMMVIRSMKEMQHLDTVVEKEPLRATTGLSGGRDWQIGAIIGPALALYERLQTVKPSLYSWLGENISPGGSTGYLPAFLINNDQHEELVNRNPGIAEFLVRILRGRNIKQYKAHPNSWLLVPPINLDPYPEVRRHLEQFRVQLETRTNPGASWWRLPPHNKTWGNAQSSLLVQPRIAARNHVALAPLGCWSMDSVLVIPSSDPLLLAVLNSTIVGFLLAGMGGASLRGGYYNMKTERWNRLPMPTLEDSTTNRLRKLTEIVLKEGVTTGGSKQCLEEIDYLVLEGYDLSTIERQMVGGWEQQMPPRIGGAMDRDDQESMEV